jgi:hypothetical protein
MLQALTKQLRQQGLHVLHAASTGAAAIRLSPSSRTCHSLFNIPVCGPMNYLHTTDTTLHLLRNAHAFIIDEFSMLTTNHLEHILLQLRHCLGLPSSDDLFQHIALIFVGDPQQLMPICRHTTRMVRHPSCSSHCDTVYCCMSRP